MEMVYWSAMTRIETKGNTFSGAKFILGELGNHRVG